MGAQSFCRRTFPFLLANSSNRAIQPIEDRSDTARGVVYVGIAEVVAYRPICRYPGRNSRLPSAWPALVWGKVQRRLFFAYSRKLGLYQHLRVSAPYHRRISSSASSDFALRRNPNMQRPRYGDGTAMVRRWYGVGWATIQSRIGGKVPESMPCAMLGSF